MPNGVLVNSIGLALGGLAGVCLRKKISEGLRMALTRIFGVISMSLGIVGIVKMQNIPAVVLAVVLGVVLGELLNLEARMTNWLNKRCASFFHSDDADGKIEMLIGVVALFCASGTGLFGALQAGAAGDHTILYAKSILDFFAAMTFSAILGVVVCAIAIPQFAILMAVFLFANAIVPYTTPEMILDFTACSGMIMLATGLRIGKIQTISVVNMLPALLLVMPLTSLIQIG